MEEEKVKQRWKEYFDDSLNQPNPRERREMRTKERERVVEDISVEKSQDWIEDDEKGKGS